MPGKRSIILALAAVLLTIGALWFTSRAVTPKEATMEDVLAEANMGGYQLIDTEALWERYQENSSNLLLVDTRQDWEYRTGHLKGAMNFPMEPTWWSRWRKEGPMEAFLGPDKNRVLVFYWAGLTWVRSDSAARVAVKLGYKNVYRDPKGYPEWQQAGLPVASAPAGLSETSAEPQAPGPLYGWAMIWTLLGIFAGGMALNLTPCVYPLIPITVSYFLGQEAKGGQGKLIGHGLCYMLGLALTNSTLGVIAAMTGGLMGAILQNPMVLVLVATILVIFATSLFGFWELRLPGGFTQAAAKSYAGHFGSLFMGLTLGVVAAPCIGPFVLGLLTWVASMGSLWLGFLIFFTLSLGLGLPLFLLAVFSGQLEKLPRSGGWMIWVRKLMGWVLIGMAACFVRPLVPETGEVLLLAAIALAAGIHLGWLDKNQANFIAFPWMKTAAGVVCIAAAAFVVTSWAMRGPGVTWRPYSEQILAEAQKMKKAVIIDFYATWCAPCRELDELTFHDAAIVKEAERAFVMIKVDVTKGGNPVYERLLQEYGVKGVPTVVFLDANGKERRDLRLVDYLPPDQFAGRMAALQESGS